MAIFIGRETDFAWQFHNLLFADTELTHSSLSPSVHLAAIADREGVERASSNVLHIENAILLVEELDEGRRGSDLNCLGETELSFIAATPGVQVALIGHDHRVAVTTCDHCDTLISQRFQNLGFIRCSRATMAGDALVTCAHAEYVTVTSQVQRVILSAGNLK